MRHRTVLSIFALASVAACTKTDTTPVDSALSIGAATMPIDSLSAAERVGTANALAAPAQAAVIQAPSAPRRASTTRRSSSGSGSSASSGSNRSTASAPAPTGTTIKKNTKRDAAIGAAAGAIIGATTTGKVKGAVVGGVVGGVLGGVIGNNVDVKKKKK